MVQFYGAGADLMSDGGCYEERTPPFPGEFLGSGNDPRSGNLIW